MHQPGDTLVSSDGGDQYTGLDRFGRVIDQNWINTSTGASVSRFQNGYDEDGNALYKNDLVTSTNSELYSYDDLNRLTSYEVGTLSTDHTSIVGTPSDTWTASLDGVGDRNSVTVNGTQTNSSFDAQNEQTGYGSATLAYNNAGDMTTDQNGNSGYTYDAWGRLVYGIDGDNAFSYDALGRRVTTGTTEQLFYSASGQVIEDRHLHNDQYGNPHLDSIDTYVWGPSYVNQVVLQDHYDESTSTTTRTYAMQDANYNAVVITNSSGTVLDRFAYDQDGNLRSGTPASDGWVYLWQGMRQVTIGSGSTATILYESQSRFDNPQLGTWISPDPEQYINGMNYYQMELGNPISQVDPSGLDTTVGGLGPSPAAMQQARAMAARASQPSPGVMTPFATGAVMAPAGWEYGLRWVAGAGVDVPIIGEVDLFVLRGVMAMETVNRMQTIAAYNNFAKPQPLWLGPSAILPPDTSFVSSGASFDTVYQGEDEDAKECPGESAEAKNKPGETKPEEAKPETRNPAQDKMLTPGEIRRLLANGIDPHDWKPNSKYDFYKDKYGNIYVKPKGDPGPGDPTGLNINDY